MRSPLIALAVSTAVLAGCSSLPMATNADVEQLKYKQDSYQCEKETHVEPILFEMYLVQVFDKSRYQRCMEAKGYTF